MIVITAALALGGGTRPGFLSDVIVQLLAVPLLILGILSHAGLTGARTAARSRPDARLGGPTDVPTPVRWALMFVAAVAAVPLVQLVPLPAFLWSLLPGRDLIKGTFETLGEAAPTMPLSVAPASTWLAFLSLISPLAVFLATLKLGFAQRRKICQLVFAFAIFSVFLGLTQLAQGVKSPLRFYEITNVTEAVGFFANRNHFASLLYVATMMAACFAADMMFRVQMQNKRVLLNSIALLWAGGSLLCLAILVLAQAMARSRAGLVLSIGALFAALTLIWSDPRGRSDGADAAQRNVRLIIGAAIFGIVFSLQFALLRILERFSVEPNEDARVLFARKTWALVAQYLPFGSGIGTFVPVYGAFEKPEEVFSAYANRAHNDVLEALLESGVFAVALMGIAAVWLGRTAWVLWKHPPATSKPVDLLLMRASAVALALLALHSLADYPLRTTAMSTLAAFLAGLLFVPSKAASDAAQKHIATDKSEPVGKGASTAAANPAPVPATAPVRVRQPWVSDKELPQAWRAATARADARPVAAETPQPAPPSVPGGDKAAEQEN